MPTPCCAVSSCSKVRRACVPTISTRAPRCRRCSRPTSLERHVRAALAKGIALCEQHKDFVSRDILKAQLADTEEDHAYWLEQQLGLIARMGLENYLQSQI